ncbi:hypothetical protein B0H13DRAFT_2016374 [Mycena leptocephala]|nr:hypothetical protein B0H13DRAFT_2016374 [Mycena leptocephala]
MIMLRKKKVRAGEMATSTRAITPEILYKVYHYNNQPKISEIKLVVRRNRNAPVDINEWGDGRSRRMLHAIQLQDLRRLKIKPFVLHELPEDQAHLCPVRALTAWLTCSRITNGYLFPTITVCDQIGDSSKLMKSEKFLEMFRNNLLDIGLDPYPYGTHSFRCGDLFASHRRWSLRRICEWGGWSMEFSNLTIVKYLIGWNDDPTELREDFLNPNQ